jgi:hypothetical protein
VDSELLVPARRPRPPPDLRVAPDLRAAPLRAPPLRAPFLAVVFRAPLRAPFLAVVFRTPLRAPFFVAPLRAPVRFVADFFVPALFNADLREPFFPVDFFAVDLRFVVALAIFGPHSEAPVKCNRQEAQIPYCG